MKLPCPGEALHVRGATHTAPFDARLPRGENGALLRRGAAKVCHDQIARQAWRANSLNRQSAQANRPPCLQLCTHDAYDVRAERVCEEPGVGEMCVKNSPVFAKKTVVDV